MTDDWKVVDKSYNTVNILIIVFVVGVLAFYFLSSYNPEYNYGDDMDDTPIAITTVEFLNTTWDFDDWYGETMYIKGNVTDIEEVSNVTGLEYLVLDDVVEIAILPEDAELFSIGDYVYLECIYKGAYRLSYVDEM